MSDECGCGWTPSETFPAEVAKGDWCPIGPMNLHHWHRRGGVEGERQCVFCSRTSSSSRLVVQTRKGAETR